MIEYSAYTHVGNVRENNEDNLYYPGAEVVMRGKSFSSSGKANPPCVFAVCDGMGGQDFGELAAFEATKALTELDAAITKKPRSDVNALVQDYVTKANDIICGIVRQKSIRLGTTLALIVVTKKGIMPYNIGDSRIYELAGGKLRQVSEDHTLAAHKVRMGILTQEQARTDKGRNKLMRFLGVFEDEMTMVAEPLPILSLMRRRVLLCSDGLTDMVEDKRIEDILSNAPISRAAELLALEALSNGGRDNITCLVFEYAGKGFFGRFFGNLFC